MKKYTSYWTILCLVIFISCQGNQSRHTSAKAENNVILLEGDQIDYRLREHVQILQDPEQSLKIEEVSNAAFNKFQAFPTHNLDLKTHTYYWGKLEVQNKLKEAPKNQEWVLTFSNSWTDLEVFTKDSNGRFQKERNGTFTSDRFKSFAPTAKGNSIKLFLPPNTINTIYFRGISDRKAVIPSFYLHLQHLEEYYNRLVKTKVGNAIFMGFLLMMFLYNLIVYFFGKDRSFIFYSTYLFMIVIYSGYLSDDISDWLGNRIFYNTPKYQLFLKLSIYLAMMAYLSFIRSFLDLGKLLPKWDTFFKYIVYLGFPVMVLDIIILLTTNFSYVIEDRLAISYILMVILSCCVFIYPLYKTREKNGYFIIAGISTICIGAFITVLSKNLLPPFSLFYLKLGTLFEVIIFSLGLAFRQRRQNIAQQEAAFKLKESQLLQEKKQSEANRLKELNAFKSKFYTNITHEFRTPLTVIMGMNENIKNHELEQNLIRRNSEGLLQLINQLLDLSKLESGALKLNYTLQDIIPYLKYLTESFYSEAKQKNIRLLFHSEAKQVIMDFDEEKIKQIVYNLLSNALKFTPENGKIFFHASTVLNKDQTESLKLKVIDSGIGIHPKSLTHIFDRFFQVNQSPNNNNNYQLGGTGIGLALTKELTELMQGKIEVQSVVGEGTEFIIHLPIEQNSEHPKESTFKDKNPNGKQATPTAEDLIQQSANMEMDEMVDSIPNFPEVLIIEDNPDIVTYIKSILKNHYNIHSAKNGRLGINQALKLIPDIIICDVMMPEKNGYEVCEILKQEERTSHIPIILLTAKSTKVDKLDAYKFGADAYLTKPFDKEELLTRIHNLIEVRKKLQEHYSTTFGNPNSTRVQKEDSLDNQFLNKLQDQIQIHLNDHSFGVPQLALKSGMSQMQMYRKLKALTGKTPSQFIRSFRLQRALELLQNSTLSVSEIAYDVGFSDPSYFSRVFQKEFGRNPSSFLNS